LYVYTLVPLSLFSFLPYFSSSFLSCYILIHASLFLSSWVQSFSCVLLALNAVLFFRFFLFLPLCPVFVFPLLLTLFLLTFYFSHICILFCFFPNNCFVSLTMSGLILYLINGQVWS
jgi:hypothetical protein